LWFFCLKVVAIFFGAANRWQRKTEPNQTKPSERSMQTEARTIRGFLAEDKSIKPQPQPKPKAWRCCRCCCRAATCCWRAGHEWKPATPAHYGHLSLLFQAWTWLAANCKLTTPLMTIMTQRNSSGTALPGG